jgi:hypothetical protein
MFVLAPRQLRPEQSQQLALPGDDFPDEPSLIGRRFREELHQFLNSFFSRGNAVPNPLARIGRSGAPCSFRHIPPPMMIVRRFGLDCKRIHSKRPVT